VTVDWRGPFWLRPLAEFAGIKIFDRVTTVQLRGAQYTDSVVEQLLHMKQIEKIYLGKTQITEEGMKQLREGLPNTEIQVGPA